MYLVYAIAWKLCGSRGGSSIVSGRARYKVAVNAFWAVSPTAHLQHCKGKATRKLQI